MNRTSHAIQWQVSAPGLFNAHSNLSHSSHETSRKPRQQVPAIQASVWVLRVLTLEIRTRDMGFVVLRQVDRC